MHLSASEVSPLLGLRMIGKGTGRFFQGYGLLEEERPRWQTRRGKTPIITADIHTNTDVQIPTNR